MYREPSQMARRLGSVLIPRPKDHQDCDSEVKMMLKNREKVVMELVVVVVVVRAGDLQDLIFSALQRQPS